MYGGCKKITINQRLGLFPEQSGKLRSFGSGIALNMKFRIDLIHILLDAPLGEIELFRNLAVGKPLRHQLHDFKFPRCQHVEGCRASAGCVSRRCCFAKLQFKGKKLIFACCLIGMFIPAQMTMIPLFIEISNLKLVDTIWAVILPGLTSVFGVFLMRQNMQSFPTELIESARIDGCSEWRIFWRIVLPNMWPSVTSLSILSFVNQWGNFMWPLIALNSKEHYTMPLVISLMVQPGMFTNYGAVMVGAVLTTLPVLIFFLIFQKKFINGMLSGALKG